MLRKKKFDLSILTRIKERDRADRAKLEVGLGIDKRELKPYKVSLERCGSLCNY